MGIDGNRTRRCIKFLGDESGIIFTLDGALASSIILLSLFVTFVEFAQHAQTGYEQATEAEKELFAYSISESLVKNRDAANPFRGAAYFSSEKRRVEVNVLDETLLGEIRPENFGKYSIGALYERNAQDKKYYFSSESKNCIAVERFAIIKGIAERKAVIGVVVCGE